MMAGLVDHLKIRTGPTGTTVELTKTRTPAGSGGLTLCVARTG